MYEDPESYQGPKVTAQDDTRITTIGRWLRDTKLNELPQFWNVLKGEMSLVGPRPEDPSIAQTWPIKAYQEILSVRPGITSPASVQYRNEESLLAVGNLMEKYLQELGPDKRRLDLLYVRYHSLWLDLDVLMWTVLSFLPRLGAYTPPERFLYYGPITRLTRRYLSWFTFDLLVTLGSIGFTGLLWRLDRPLDVGWLKSIAFAIGFALLFSISGAIWGVQRISWSRASYQDALDLLPAWFFASGIALVFNYIFNLYPMGLILISSVITLAGFVAARYRSRVITGTLSWIIRIAGVTAPARERVLIVGSGTSAQLVAWMLDHPENSGKFKVVGFVDNDFQKQGLRIYGSASVIGFCKDTSELVKQKDVGIVILADQTIPTVEYRSIIGLRDTLPVQLAIMPDILSSLSLFAGPVSANAGHENGQRSKNYVPCLYCTARKAFLKMESRSEIAD